MCDRFQWPRYVGSRTSLRRTFLWCVPSPDLTAFAEPCLEPCISTWEVRQKVRLEPARQRPPKIWPKPLPSSVWCSTARMVSTTSPWGNFSRYVWNAFLFLYYWYIVFVFLGFKKSCLLWRVFFFLVMWNFCFIRHPLNQSKVVFEKGLVFVERFI